MFLSLSTARRRRIQFYGGGAGWDGPLPRAARCAIAYRVCSRCGPPQAEKFCLSHLACGGRQPQLFGYGWSMALGLPQVEKIRLVTERYRVRCATHAPSAVTWPADDRRRRRRRRRDHTRVIITILVAAANANATAGGCYTAIAKPSSLFVFLTIAAAHARPPRPPRLRHRTATATKHRDGRINTKTEG